MRRFTEESVWRKSVDQEDIVEKQLQNKGRSECGTDIKDELHEECGVFGAYNLKGEDIANWVYYGLFSLQHRGQESCGIAVSENRDIRYYKDMGLVSEVFTPENLDKLHGDIAVGPCALFDSGQQCACQCTAFGNKVHQRYIGYCT